MSEFTFQARREMVYTDFLIWELEQIITSKETDLQTLYARHVELKANRDAAALACGEGPKLEAPQNGS